MPTKPLLQLRRKENTISKYTQRGIIKPPWAAGKATSLSLSLRFPAPLSNNRHARGTTGVTEIKRD